MSGHTLSFSLTLRCATETPFTLPHSVIRTLNVHNISWAKWNNPAIDIGAGPSEFEWKYETVYTFYWMQSSCMINNNIICCRILLNWIHDQLEVYEQHRILKKTEDSELLIAIQNDSILMTARTFHSDRRVHLANVSLNISNPTDTIDSYRVNGTCR